MLDPQLSRFWQATLLSGLVDADGLSACWNAIPAGKREAPEHIDRRLARQAVQSGALTLWQAQQLLAGRTSGYRVDRYVLLDLIGQGGMGRVYLARDTRLNRRVALKILSPERVNNPRAIARFQREARVGAQLEHENLVRIYDFGESNGRYYLVMEFIEGKTIGTLISEQGALPISTTSRLIQQVAFGLAHAHRKGLIHRDVNPYNILVTHDGTAKLADLGLAINLTDDERVTREGATVGTFDYVAPEQARQSHSADIRSDIYSLGCTFYHMCTGQVPFPSPSLPEKLFAHQALEPIAIEQLTSGIPEPLCEIVRRMMRKSPDERFATPIEVAQALEPYVDEQAQRVESEDAHVSDAGMGVGRSHGVDASPVEAIPRIPESPRSFAKTVGETVDGTSQPGRTPDSMVQPKLSNSNNSPPSPVLDAYQSDPERGFILDLGVEPPLSEGLARPKPKSVGDRSTTSIARLVHEAWLTRAKPTRAWLWPMVVLVVALALTGAIMTLTSSLSNAPKVPGTDQTQNAKSKPEHPLDPDATRENRPPTTDGIADAAIVVRKDGENDVAFDSSKLLQAMQTAMGKEGWVELRNRRPLHIASDLAGDLASGRGRLVIRAAPGIQPVIEVEIKGGKPFLSAGSAVPVELSGLTFVVSYHQSGPSLPDNPAPPPLVIAATTARLERCAFKVAGNARVRGSRAFFSSGGALAVNRCWFQGFDLAVEIAAMRNAHALIEQTVIFANVDPARPQPTPWYGWAIKLTGEQALQTKNASPQLILDHCTFEGAGLLDLTGNPVPSTLRVEIKHCAIRAEGILACNAGTPPDSQIEWRGEGNQYDIQGPSWIVLHAREGTQALSAGATDLDGWTKLFTADNKPIRTPLKFLTEPRARSALIQPYDFAIAGSGPSQSKPGADPDSVGP
jgi:serine/threonine protein kinase